MFGTSTLNPKHLMNYTPGFRTICELTFPFSYHSHFWAAETKVYMRLEMSSWFTALASEDLLLMLMPRLNELACCWWDIFGY